MTAGEDTARQLMAGRLPLRGNARGSKLRAIRSLDAGSAARRARAPSRTAAEQVRYGLPSHRISAPSSQPRRRATAVREGLTNSEERLVRMITSATQAEGTPPSQACS